MPLYTFLHNLLNVLVQIANKMGLKKNTYVLLQVPPIGRQSEFQLCVLELLFHP
jgi:hypothetical protein